MSETTEKSDDLNSRRREPEAGDVFMMTFAAVGGLALLDVDAANAATPDATAPLAPKDVHDPRRGAPATEPVSAPATDAAFRAAIAALNSPFAGGQDLSAGALGAEDPQDVIAGSDGDVLRSGADMAASRGSPDPVGSSGPVVTTQTAAVDPTLGDDNPLAPILANDTIGALFGSSVATVGAKGTSASVPLPAPSFSFPAQADVAGAGGPAPTVGFTGQNAIAPTFEGVGHEALPREPYADSVSVGGDLAFANGASFVAGGASGWLDLSALFGNGAGADYFVANDILSVIGVYDSSAGKTTNAAVTPGPTRTL